MADLHDSSAIALAAAIREKRVSSREVLDHLLERIATVDRPLNSVVTIDAERARREADAADELVARGELLGPLHGVPMTIKDSFSTVGMRTTSGAPELSDHVPDEDAWPVAALRRAGAVIFGKTNLPIYAGDMQSYNEVFGSTNNPWDHQRTPGGSSGGSAAALAARLTPLELGSDIGGSIRLPAHMSGVYGHKPSYGIVPAHGQIPGPPGTLTQADLAVAGPMARDADDLELALDLMTGPDRWNTPGWRLELPPAKATDLGGFRVAAWLDDPICRVDPEVAAVLAAAVDRLSAAGARIDAEARPGVTLEKAASRFFPLLQAALSGEYDRPTIERFAQAEGDDQVAITKRQTAMRHRDWLSHNEGRLQLRRRFEEFFTTTDVLLMPVMPCVALRHDHSEPKAGRLVETERGERPYWEINTWMAPAGACFLPATVVPVGLTARGMPVGAQIVGPYLGDRTTLAFARAMTPVVGPCPTPPGI
jgi:amidase